MEKKPTIKEMKALVEEGNLKYLIDLTNALEKRGHYRESYRYLQIAYRKGSRRALRFICDLCNSDNLDKYLTKEEQFNWYLRSFNEEGVDYITYVMAQCYREGIGVRANLDKYIYYLRLCSEDGSTTATFELATCYEKGYGVEQSYEKAYQLYTDCVDEHFKRDITSLYKEAYYRYHELGGAIKDMETIRYILLKAGRYNTESRKLYKEIFNEDYPEDK